MPKPDLAGLTEEENALLSGCRRTLEQDTQPLPTSEKGVVASLTIDALESLAAARATAARRLALLKEHQYQIKGPAPGFWLRCVGCSVLAGKPCTPDCTLAAELRGGG